MNTNGTEQNRMYNMNNMNNMNNTEIIAYQTGQMREKFFKGELDEEYNDKPVEIDNYKLTRKFLTHRDEAEREAQDWNEIWNDPGLEIYDGIKLGDFKIIISIGSSSVQAWINGGEAIVPPSEKGKQYHDSNFMNCGTGSTETSDNTINHLSDILI